MTEHIVPRWEWRTFGERFDDAERRFADLSAERVVESDEIYVLSLRSDTSVKVRDDLLDVKELVRVDENGLEQWRPTLKARVPVSAAEVRAVTEALGGTSPPLARDEYALRDLMDELVRPSSEVLAVPVHKRRAHYTIGGCRAELSEVRTEHGTRATIAVESEDPALVVQTVGELGFDLAPNVSMPRELKSLAGFEAQRYAVLDVGTNSVKFHIAERAADGEWRGIVDRAEVTRLGEGLDQGGLLRDEPVERTVAAIAAMAEEARRHGVAGIAAGGTAWMRIAENTELLVEAVRDRASVHVEPIDGAEEARLAFAAVQRGLDDTRGSLVVFDTGGGSSQFTFGRDGQVAEMFSVNVGAARFTERFGLDSTIDEDTLAQALDAIAADLSRLDGRPAPDAVVGIGGAVTNLTAVKLGLTAYDPDAIRGTVLDRAEIDRQIELYRTTTTDERREIVGLQPKRAEVILAGACIVRTILTKLRAESFTVSDRGLRHQLIVERFE